jgi:hypothetical protein
MTIEPTVNILYIRGTVAALGRFAPLLTRHTPWSYRLVANGCPPEEVALLHHIAGTHERLQVHDLRVPEVLPHGKALCGLADAFPGEEFFAFMDSDVIVTGDFTTALAPLLELNDAVFSGSTIWARPEDTVLTSAHREVCGPHNRTESGILLGNSYTGVYRRDAFDDVCVRCQVSPDKYTTGDLAHLAPEFLAFLAEHDLVREDYTPPKVLTLGFAFLRRPVAYLDVADLHHIGGFSLTVYQQQVTAGTAGSDQATTSEILDFSDDRRHMVRKIAVCQRVTRSFAAMDATGRPWRGGDLPPDVEDEVRLIEDLYAEQAHLIPS